MSLVSTLSDNLAALRAAHLERHLRIITARRGAVVETNHGSAIDFSSNDYLGLGADPRLVAAACEAAARVGGGATASRLIAGNTDEHERLDANLAEFFDVEAALSFASGYAANTGSIPALVGRGDVIFSDELNHASLIDGCRLSRATTHVYSHGDVTSLGALLEAHRASHRHALIVTDGMFSMDGDTAPLGEIVSLARQYDAWTYVDDAHAVGVSGANGRGSVERLGLVRDVDVLVGTLGKAFGVAGAFALGPKVLRDFLINRARSFIFSTGPMPAQAAAARAALDLVRAEPSLRARVPENACKLRRSLADVGIATIGEPDSHIIPIVIGDAMRTVRIGAALADRGFLVGAVRPPTVAPGTSRLRVTVSAAHTPDHLDAFAESLASVMSIS